MATNWITLFTGVGRSQYLIPCLSNPHISSFLSCIPNAHKPTHAHPQKRLRTLACTRTHIHMHTHSLNQPNPYS